MPATEKNANAFDMTTLSAVNSGYSLMLINNSTNEGQLITMTDLATMILNEIRNQTFTATELGQTAASTLPAAISSLNSATVRYTPDTNHSILSNSDLNDYTEPGTYYCFSQNYSTIANCPVANTFRLDVVDIKPRAASGRYIYAYQEIILQTAPWKIYRRRIAVGNTTGSWEFGDWYVIEGSAMS